MGKIELIAIIIAVILVIGIVFKLIKGAAKFVFLVAGIIIVLASFNIIKVEDVVPSQLVSITNAQVEKVNKLKDLAQAASDSVKLDTSSGKVALSIKLNNQWVEISSLEKIQKTATGKVTVVLNGKEIKIEDEKMAEVLKYILDQK